MNTIKFLIIALVFGAVFYSCEDELPELDALVDASEVNFRVVQDYDVDPGGNTVILISETPEAVPIWDYGTGRSNRVIDTIRFAFQGEYVIKYSALTGGGVVEKDPVTITVTEDNLNYVNDPLWTALSGGVGNSKVWYLDLDAEGVSKYFLGPLYFAGSDIGWEYSCLGDPDLCWYWEADWPGNSWIGDAGDYGSMTFSLDGGPFVTVDHLFTTDRGLENGTYFLDINTRTLTMTDAAILQNSWAAADITDWDNYKIISLTEDAMQLAATKAAAPEVIIFNFISKDYSDNWVPEETGDPEIPIDLGGGTANDLLSVTTSKTWTLSPDSPFNWTDLEGTFLNSWETVEDYPGWAGFTSANQAEVASNKITFSSNGDLKLTYADGSEVEGTYSVDESSNVVTFEGAVPAFPIGDWVVAAPTAANQWKIIKTEQTGGVFTDIWFGTRAEVNAEYMVFHFVLGDSSFDPLEAARKEILKTLTGSDAPGGSRTFRVSDTWHVDWLAADFTGGWTNETTFGDDFSSNSWVWTEAVQQGLQEPRLTFDYDGTTLTCTRLQDGIETSAPVTIDAENKSITVDMNLIEFVDAASWLVSYGPTWTFCKTALADVESVGMWLGTPNPDNESEVVAIHYIIE